MYSSGDLVLVQMQFVDSLEVKKRPALVLYKEYDNLVVAGITSNKKMKGVVIPQGELHVESVVKINYIFTFSSSFVSKKLGSVSSRVWNQVRKELLSRIPESIR